MWHKSWTVPDYVPTGDVHAISSGVSTPMTLGVN
jgi:hypothetical protein